MVRRAVAMSAISRRSREISPGRAGDRSRSSSHPDRGVPMPCPAGHPTAGLPRQRLAPAAQPRQQVLHLRQRDLRLALPAPRVLGEDVQDQPGPIDDLDLDHVLELAQLAGGQLAVADHRVGAASATTTSRSSTDLARPDVRGGIGLVPTLDQAVAAPASRRSRRARASSASESSASSSVPDGPHADQDDPLEPHLPVLDLGDVLQLGGQARDAAERLPVEQVGRVIHSWPTIPGRSSPGRRSRPAPPTRCRHRPATSHSPRRRAPAR